jgi:hypothetical protein
LVGYFPTVAEAGSEEEYAKLRGLEPNMKSEDYYNRVSNMVRAYCALAEVR